MSTLAKDPKKIKDPYARRDAIVKENRKQHRRFLQDAYDKTHKLVKNMMEKTV